MTKLNIPAGKKFLLLVLLLVVHLTGLIAQSENGTYTIANVPAEGVILDTGWKYQVSDNIIYANPGFDDSAWQTINPTQDIHQLPQLKSGISWFRLKLHLDTSVISQSLALVLFQSGASEIYVNGKLLKSFGKISTNEKEILAYDPLGKPFPFKYLKAGENLLAIRYTLQPGLLYAKIMNRTNPAFSIQVNTIESAIGIFQKEETRSKSSVIFRIGAFVLLLILHLAFYLYYPSQKANLFFSIYAAFILAAESCALLTINEVKYIYYYWNTIAVCGTLSHFFLLTALYFLLNRKKGWIYWSLLFLSIIGSILIVSVYGAGFVTSMMFSTLLSFEIVRIALIAVKNKQRGAWIIATGAINYYLFWIFFLYLAITQQIWIPLTTIFNIGDLVYNLFYISIPFATSVFLALDFAFTSRSLQQKLVEVEKLSEKTLLQEREKQQILAAQKELLEEQVSQRTAELKESLQELKSTQGQLIQAAKMASLGELTAGIAHEIQNPLNFVNNFSEVSTELVDEMQEAIEEDHKDEAIVIATDIKENLLKINHHGKRADAIVKGMLQHSRTSTGKKEPTYINALADEYLRLSYHGLIAKDKDFNATIETHFDDSVGKIGVVPQDIGRVLLNLYNNAFYSMNEKKKLLNGTFEPTVLVRTKRVGDKVELSVKDNGNGIPQKIVDKIFQPFFTTKPTGKGTGLGLSLSYDIIKAHGGELKVETKEGKGAEFVIQLPAKENL